MSGPLRNTTMQVAFEVDTRQLDNAVKQINSAIQSAQSLEQGASQSGRAIEHAGRNYESAARSVENNNNALRENTNRVRDADRQQNNLANSARRTSDSLREQSRNADNASRSLKGTQSAVERLNGALKTMGVAYFADKVLDIGKAAISTGMEFDKQMSAVRAISGATGSQFKALEDQAISLGASTTKSASEVAAGQLELAKSGLTVKQTLAAMPGVISASTASGEDMARTSEVMTAALNGFQLKASAANHVADVLAQTANKTKADINDLGYAFKYAAPVAHTLGYSLESVAAATGIMTDAGMAGEQAGTSLRAALIALTSPSKEASKEMAGLGVKVTDAHGNMLPFSNIIGQLGAKTKDMGNAQKLAAMSTIFGTEAASGMLDVVNAGPEKLDKLTASIKDSDGASKKASDAMSDNFAGAVEQLSGTIDSISINVSKVLTPSLRAATNWLSDMGDKFNELSPTGKQIAVWGSIAVAGIVPVTYVVKKASETVGWLKDSLENMHSPFTSFRREMDETSASASQMAASVQAANQAAAESQQPAGNHQNASAAQPENASGGLANTVQEVAETIGENTDNTSSGSNPATTSQASASQASASTSRRRGFFSRIFRRGASVAEDASQGAEAVAETAGNAAGSAGRLGRLASIGTSIGSKFAKGAGYLSVGLNAIDLIKSTKDNIVENIGGMTGASGGMALGSVIGSMIAPGIGTAIGGAVGSWAGTYLGSTLGDAIQKNPKIAKKVSGAFGAVKDFFKDPFATKPDFRSVSASTSKAINSYVDLESKSKEQLSLLAINGDKYSKSARDSINKNFSSMSSLVENSLGKTKKASDKNLSYLVKNGLISEKKMKELEKQQAKNQKDNLKAVQDSTKKMIQINNDGYKQEKDITAKAEAKINQIKKDAAKQGRTLSQSEQDEIKRIEIKAANDRKTVAQQTQAAISKEQEKQRKNVVASLSASAKQQKLILGRLKDESGTISAKQAASIVKSAEKTRKGAVKEAKEQFNKVKQAADEEYYVNGTIKKKEHDAIIAQAEKTRDDAIAKATDMKNKIVDQAQKQAAGHYKAVDWETGQSLSKWDNFVIGAAEKVNAFTSGINKVLAFFHFGQIDPWKPKGYASAQSIKTENFKPTNHVEATQWRYANASGTNYHPGGNSLVGEEGPELAYIPYSGKVALLGANGPEITNIPRGASILPASQTKSVLSGGLGAGKVLPGYASGVGDFAKTAYEWVLHPIEKVKGLAAQYMNFGKNDIGPGKGLGVGLMEYVRDKAGPWLKDNLSSFSGIGASAKAGSAQVAKWLTAAMALTGTPMSYLNALMRVAMHESGGNPRAINKWDSNWKAGHPSKGLMQTIDSTFNAYKLPGMDNIWNPVHNAVAAIRYMNARYGNISNVPGVKSAKYVGYKNGGRKHGNGQVLVGEEGPELVDLPDGSQIHSNSKTQDLIHKIGRGVMKFEFNSPITIQINGNADKNTVSKLERTVSDVMEKKFKEFRAILDSGIAY